MAVGTVWTFWHGAECTVFRCYYSIITKAALFYKETVRASGMVPGVRTIGQGQLMVQLAKRKGTNSRKKPQSQPQT